MDLENAYLDDQIESLSEEDKKELDRLKNNPLKEFLDSKNDSQTESHGKS